MIRFDEIVVGASLPERSLLVTREALKAYADAGGDHNPLHRDDDFARRVGFDGIIAHGMFSMGNLAHCLVDWIGDPSPITRMKAPFRALVFPGDTITAGGRVRALDHRTRTALLDLRVTVPRDGNLEEAIRRGEAEIRFPM
jgi:acyl dehydratase